MFKYIFRPYDPIYPKLFSKEKERLRKFLRKGVLIEHIGSTAVPGLGGKGIIDIVITAPDKKSLSEISSRLIEAGYYYEPEDGTDERWFHGRKISDDERYHLHLTFKGSRDWREMTSFRDYLKNHPEDFKRYIETKKKAVGEANQDKSIYMKVKEPIILEILKKSNTE